MVISKTRPADYIADDSRFAVVDDLHVHYKRAGHGVPVLLLHGSGSSLQSFDRTANNLTEAFDIIRPDLPGFGLTGPRSDRDYRISALTATVAGFIDALGLAKPVVVGNSLGGNIAWNLAVDHPDRVRGLVLVNATGYPGKSLPLALRLARNPIGRALLTHANSTGAVARHLRSIVGPGSTQVVDAAMVQRVHAMMTRPGNQQAFIDFACTDQVDRTTELPGIRMPTLVLRSADIDGQHFARDIPDAREAVNSQTGHLIPDEDPDWLSDRIRDFATRTLLADDTDN
ncbi:alpha/beta fold hydrolase [Gordonia hankookensis]|uniref:Alpha/beta hydrolase n=1 Tax=Gordonia hankookensis TaxID=589403 RepID=A0ABR7WK81_9ACTN|nr:alpha/beta hydrolase [Gordonia hankookensis]MBD1322167.1 alpha/beta hydrolase [Gordonia hankookensis]